MIRFAKVSPTAKTLLALGSLVPLPALTALLVAAMYGGFDGTPDGPLEESLFWLYWVLLAVALVTWVWTLIVIWRSPLLTRDDRNLWLLITFLGNVFALPLAWWVVVRPGPDGPGVTPGWR